MKRYDLGGHDGFMREEENGQWIDFDDHQAEIVRLKNLLAECEHLWFYGLENTQPDEEELRRRVKIEIAQKDSTQVK